MEGLGTQSLDRKNRLKVNCKVLSIFSIGIYLPEQRLHTQC